MVLFQLKRALANEERSVGDSFRDFDEADPSVSSSHRRRHRRDGGGGGGGVSFDDYNM